MKLKQFTKAVAKMGIRADGKQLYSYRLKYDPDGDVIAVKCVGMHDDPLDFKKETILPADHPKVQELKDKAKLEAP